MSTDTKKKISKLAFNTTLGAVYFLEFLILAVLFNNIATELMRYNAQNNAIVQVNEVTK